MAKRDIVVIGGSAGAISVLMRLVARLPEDFPASLFVVVHFPEGSESFLPAILNREGQLPAAPAGDHEPIRPGRIYVAPPGRHMLLANGRVALRRGPGENGFRPAVDPLFRSAARAFGPRVIAVVLSGTLDDGTAGLAHVTENGGIAVVQDPEDAESSGMPESAIRSVRVDYVVPAADLAPLLGRLISEDVPDAPEHARAGALEQEKMPPPVEELPAGEGLTLTCPDCHGVLTEKRDAGVLRYECQVGHVYTVESADAAQADSTERALWAALRALRERIQLTRRLAERSRRHGHQPVAERFESRARRMEADESAISRLLVNSEER
jgi:two-component system chemotaxis response regulator CheB